MTASTTRTVLQQKQLFPAKLRGVGIALVKWVKTVFHFSLCAETRVAGDTGLEKEIYYIADNIGREWRMLARTLGVKEAEVERIGEAHARDLREQCRKCLLTWCTDASPGVNRLKLIQALREINQNYIADEVEDM